MSILLIPNDSISKFSALVTYKVIATYEINLDQPMLSYVSSQQTSLCKLAFERQALTADSDLFCFISDVRYTIMVLLSPIVGLCRQNGSTMYVESLVLI